MHRAQFMRYALAVAATALLSSACTMLNHPPERIWPASTPGSYPGNTYSTSSGEWWFPSEIGPLEIPAEGGNKGTIFYSGATVPEPEGAPARMPAPMPVKEITMPRRPPPAPPGVVQRVVYDRVFVDTEVMAERLIFPAITFAHNSAALDGEGQTQVRQAAAAIARARGYDVVIEGRREADERHGLDSERADVVVGALRSAGVAPGRLSTKALGVDPLSNKDTPVGRELNRCAALAMIPAGLDLDARGPEDDPMPDVPEGMRLETVHWRVEIPVPTIVYMDRLVFPNILFDYDKATLRPEGLLRTDRAAEAVMSLNKVSRLTVVGHCDHLGSHEYNDGLSVRRANAVRDRLVQQGLSADMVQAKGKGKRQPIADNTAPAGRQLNRRVELHVEYSK